MIRQPAIAFLLLAAVLLPLRAPADEHGPISIGATLTLTGETAFWGTNARRGIELALEEINQSGGINGRPLHGIFENFQLFDLKMAASAAGKLVSVDRVPVILTQWSEDSEVVWPIAARAQTVVVSIAAGAKDLTKKSPLLFRVWPSDELFVRAEVDEALRQGKRKAAIIGAQTAYFASLQAVTAELWQQSTGQPAAVFEVVPTSDDYRSILAKIKNDGCDVVFLHVPTEREGILLRQARDLGLNILKIGTQQSDSKAVIDVAGDAADGVIYPEYSPPTPEFVSAYRDRYKEDPGVPAEYAYDAVKLVAKAMRDHGPTSTGVRKGLLATKDYSGASGAITITGDRDRVGKPVLLKVIRNGIGAPWTPRSPDAEQPRQLGLPQPRP